MFSRHKLLCGNRLGKKNPAIARGCDKPKIGYTRVHFHENMVDKPVDGIELWVFPSFSETPIWVCLKIGYIPNYSHLIGIMISKTIGFRGTLFSETPI